MARELVAEVLLPLVKGGTLHVGRPVARRSLETMAAAWRRAETFTHERSGQGGAPQAHRDGAPSSAELAAVARDVAARVGRRSYEAALELGVRRAAVAATLLPDARPPPLDETSLRLGAAVHNLIALSHPGFEGRGFERRQARLAAAAREMAAIGPPPNEEEAVWRHSLLARLGDVTRSDYTVHFWIGQRSFVGRPPPPRLTAMPRLRSVHVDTVSRSWLRDIGIAPAGRPALLALYEASPLGEALDPLRLDPPPSWVRLLSVLRFRTLCRVVAGRVVEIGVHAAGGALTSALFRFASRQEPGADVAATPEAVAFAIRFLAHTVWLDQMWSRGRDPSQPVDLAGSLDLKALLAAAETVEPSLVWPADVARGSPAARELEGRLAGYRARARAQAAGRYGAAVALARYAAGHGNLLPPAGTMTPPTPRAGGTTA